MEHQCGCRRAPDARILGHEDLTSLRRHLLQIRAQMVQVMPAYDQSRPRPSHELGCALARICEGTHRAADSIALTLGLNPRPSSAVTRRTVDEIEPGCHEAMTEFVDVLPQAGSRELAPLMPGKAVRAAELLLEWADSWVAEYQAFLDEEARATEESVRPSAPTSDFGGFTDPVESSRYYSPGVAR